MWTRLKKSKTFWAGLVALASAAGGYLTGEMTWAQALQVAVPAVLAIFVRDGIEKLV